jgi:hypothetical protein
MEQFIFFALLYSVGLMFGLQFYRKLPLTFIALTAFFWGVLGWVILAVVLCSLALPFTFRLMATIEILIVIGLAIMFLRNAKGNFQHAELLILLAANLFFLLSTVLSMKFNAANLTNDSYYIILYGEIIAYSGFFSGSVVLTPFAYGILVPILQAAAPFLKLDYLYAFQPIFSILFLGTMFYLINYALRKIIQNSIYAIFLSALGVFAFASAPGVLYHIFYIHTNFITASYLFLCVVTFWLGLWEENYTWFIFSALALLAFSLARTETPIFALFIMILMVKYLNYRNRLTILLPLVLAIILWEGTSLFLFPENDYVMVNKAQTLLVISFYVIFTLFLIFSRHRIISKFIVSYITRYLIMGSALGVVVIFTAKTELSLENLTNTMQNLLLAGGWGISWVLVFFLMAFSYSLPRFKNEEVFPLNIILFFVFILVLGFFRVSYSVLWTDSVNRMSLHILPLSIFYLTIKYGQVVDKGDKAPVEILLN